MRDLALAFVLNIVFYLFNPTSQNIFRVYSLFFVVLSLNLEV